jgi:hypothetical protein
MTVISRAKKSFLFLLNDYEKFCVNSTDNHPTTIKDSYDLQPSTSLPPNPLASSAVTRFNTPQ